MPIPENPSLEEVLHNDTLLRSFQNHNATKLYDPKPVPFLLAAEEFQKAALDPTVSVEQLSRMASKMATDYVKPDDFVQKGAGIGGDGEDFLNIPSTVSKKTNANVDKLGKIARGELPTPSRQELAATFEDAHTEMTSVIKDRGNNLDSWKKTPAFKEALGAARDIENAENRVAQLEQKAEKLQSSKWEQFKAFFKGGVQKQMEKMVAEIDKAKMDVLLRTDPERFENIQREKQKMAEKMGQKQTKLTPDKDQFLQVKNAVFQLSLESTGSHVSQKDRPGLEKLADQAPGMLASQKAADNMGKEQTTLTKSVKVGEALKGTLGKSVGQGQTGPKVH